MEITLKNIRDGSVDVNIPGQININQDSEAKVKVENKNSAIGITDANFCLLVEKDGAVSKLTLDPQDKSKIICTAYYRDEDETLLKKEVYAVINFVEEEVEEYLSEDINDPDSNGKNE